MTGIRMIMLSLLAVFAFSAVATATASAECSGTAPEHKCIWEVKRTEAGAFAKLESGEEVFIQTIPLVDSTTFTLNAGTTHEIVCTKLVATDRLLGGSPGTDKADVEFLACTTPNEATCKVKSKGNTEAGEIFVQSIKTKLVEREKSGTKNILSDNFEQRTVNGTKEFVTLEFGTTEILEESGTRVLTGTCVKYPGSTKVKGNVAAESKGEELDFPGPTELTGNTLEVFGETAKLVGKVTLVLESGEWRAA